jgi:hypothetical protein
MSATVRILGVAAPTGQKVVARLFAPAGVTWPAGITTDNGWTLATAGTTLDVPLSEDGSTGDYSGQVIVSPELPDAVTLPYEYQARQVPTGTDLTNMAGVAAAYAASTTVRRTRGAFGFLRSGDWFVGDADANIVEINGTTFVGSTVPASLLLSPNANQVVGTMTVYDGDGNAMVNTLVEFQLISTTQGAPGGAFMRRTVPVDSGPSGSISRPFMQSSSYQVRIDGGAWSTFSTPSNGTPFSVNQALGRQSP